MSIVCAKSSYISISPKIVTQENHLNLKELNSSKKV